MALPATSVPVNGRFLAVQGRYLYVELASVVDQEAYDLAFMNTPPSSTQGIWTTTSWGAHAVATLNLSMDAALATFTFQDVPLDGNLTARAIQDLSDTVFEESWSTYQTGDFEPLAETRENHVVSAEELSTGTISLSLIPSLASTEVLTWSGGTVSHDLVAEDILGSRNPVGLSEFTGLVVDSRDAENQIADVGLLVGYRAATSQPLAASPWDFRKADQEGTPLDWGSAFDWTGVGDGGSYRILTGVFAENSVHDPFFVGVTPLLETLPIGLSSFVVSYGILNDTDAGFSWDSETQILEAGWSLPSDTPLGHDDLEFQVFAWTTENAVALPIGQISELDSDLGGATPVLINDWDDPVELGNLGSSDYVLNLDVSEFDLSYDGFGFAYMVVLARIPGSDPFFYAQNEVVGDLRIEVQ